jgi:hypothetical protein
MSATLFDFSVPALIHGLSNLSAIIDKAAAQTSAKNVDPKTVADARLILDMLPFKRQVQIACDAAKGAAARLAGIENPKHEDSEEDLTQLKARITKTIEFVSSVTPAQLVGAESREIVLQYPNITLKFDGLGFLTKFALPNFYFHITAAYAILRANGVDVGKGDYLGKIQ